MRSDRASASAPAGADAGRAYRRHLTEAATPELLQGEQIVAMLPFATVPKLAPPPRTLSRKERRQQKVRSGIRQSWRRYRPVVVTGRRLLVFDSGRAPNPRSLLGAFPLDQVTMGAVTKGRWGVSQFTLGLPGNGDVPFETGRREAGDLARLREILSEGRQAMR